MAEERLNAYYDNLNDSEDLQKEQEMLNGGAHMIGGKKKSDESNFSSYITQMEKELKLQTVRTEPDLGLYNSCPTSEEKP